MVRLVSRRESDAALGPTALRDHVRKEGAADAPPEVFLCMNRSATSFYAGRINIGPAGDDMRDEALKLAAKVLCGASGRPPKKVPTTEGIRKHQRRSAAPCGAYDHDAIEIVDHRSGAERSLGRQGIDLRRTVRCRDHDHAPPTGVGVSQNLRHDRGIVGQWLLKCIAAIRENPCVESAAFPVCRKQCIQVGRWPAKSPLSSPSAMDSLQDRQLADCVVGDGCSPPRTEGSP